MAKVRAKHRKKAEAKVAQSKAPAQKQVKQASGDDQPEDSMSQCVALCQQERWRAACLLCRRMRDRASRSGKMDLHASLSGALLKINYSLRRQMAAGLMNAAKALLAKEYLLDVGE